jgi:hypothetical protein
MTEPRDPKEESTLQNELSSMLGQEELKWRQQAKEDWLKFGDRNTKFFHACATQKNRRQHITRIIERRGKVVSLMQI